MFQVRKAELQDHACMVSMNIAMARETESLELDFDTVSKGMLHMLENPSLGFYVVALHEEQVVGMCGITFEWSDWRNALFWWIQSVYVDPKWRRQGVFTSLYGWIRSLAKDQNLAGLRLYHEVENHSSEKTYHKMGMITCDYRMMEEDFVLGDREHKH